MITKSLCDLQCWSWAHWDLYWNWRYVGGAGCRGQSGCLWLRCEAAPAAVPHGSSRGILLKFLSLKTLFLVLHQYFSELLCSVVDTAKIQVKNFLQNTALKNIRWEKNFQYSFLFSLNLTSLVFLSLDARERRQLHFRFDTQLLACSS